MFFRTPVRFFTPTPSSSIFGIKTKESNKSTSPSFRLPMHLPPSDSLLSMTIIRSSIVAATLSILESDFLPLVRCISEDEDANKNERNSSTLADHRWLRNEFTQGSLLLFLVA